MSIKFILDNNAISKNREELQHIIDSLKEKSVPTDRKADFLRKFMLASINTFKKEYKYHPQIKEIKIEAPQRRVISLKNPPPKLDLSLQQFLHAPSKIKIPEELLESAPEKES